MILQRFNIMADNDSTFPDTESVVRAIISHDVAVNEAMEQSTDSPFTNGSAVSDAIIRERAARLAAEQSPPTAA
jgi:hypothetical protein